MSSIELTPQSKYSQGRAMSSHSRHNSHDKYKTRIDSLLKSYAAEDSSPESQAHNAKYLAILVSGYLEQAIKELLLDYAQLGTRPQVSRYVEETWPSSKNMKTDNIETILRQFSSTWAEEFAGWLSQEENRKGDINSIVEWRNRIAHGQESNTNGVTLYSVRSKFVTIRELVSLIDSMVRS